MKFTNALLSLWFVPLLLLSCTSDVVDSENPSISIVSPAEGAHFVTGDTVHIQVQFSDNDGLHALTVHLHNETTDMHEIENQYDPDVMSFTASVDYIVDEVVATDYTLELTASDHSGNSATASRPFTSN